QNARQSLDCLCLAGANHRIAALRARLGRSIARQERRDVTAPHIEGSGTRGLEIAREAFVDPAHHRGQRDNDEDADGHTHDGERGSDLVRPQRIEGDADAFQRLKDFPADAHAHSCLSASIGSNNEARRAGYTPETMPTTVPSSVAATIDQGATAAGSGVCDETSFAAARPSMMPMIAPSVLNVAASTRNWLRMSRRRAPSDLRMPISRVRSATATS